MHTTFSTNTTSSTARIHGGELHVHASGTFGGGTVKIQFQADNGLWYDIAGAAWTTAADELIDLGNQQSYTVRAVLTGATTPSLFLNIRD
jgi:hypothetical protein